MAKRSKSAVRRGARHLREATTRGAFELQQWLIKTENEQDDLAALLSAAVGHDVHQATVSTWTGSMRPRADRAVALQKITGIQVAAWFDKLPRPMRAEERAA